ncbi:MAG TPA: Asp-tRNA(Asn)/Glu-tRNA(Gln) amidotransferase subunit GatB [Anaerolineaceae bacterium]|nr:Asp-tRNA(Asn)/Glu-tRNA(Gln) amidotransferase subunit GatB [Anaerolineaceae bacterium]HUM50128.1 Asp-tRNA(Asn)/Glu-tRNA(Gln) amidotransferase subunit GatB [Anaerolineaceae bacterium]
MMTQYEIVVGLETHIQLNTETKIFCSCKADSWGAEPNTNICPVCSGLPGVLPVLNAEAVHKGALLAAAMHAEINPVSYFDRKNYFYPDLPKGYQITQFDEPIGKGGYLDVHMPDGSTRRVHIHKLHLEEDAGKTKIEAGQRLVDFNRCGVPLVEMVTEPDLHSGEEAAQYLTELRQLLRWIGVSEADMERGHLRCDANVSIREAGSNVLNTKTEIKNMNSIESIRQAITLEAQRQIEAVEAGKRVESYTLDWDADTGTLRKMRSKETEADYRYFREPDLLPVVLSDEEIAHVQSSLPELPYARKMRFIEEYQLSAYDADILTSELSLSDYYEEALRLSSATPKTVSNWMINDLTRLMNDLGKSAAELRLRPADLAEIIGLVESGQISPATGKALLRKVEENGRKPAEIVVAEGLGLIGDEDTLRSQIEAVLSESPSEVASFNAGKESLLGWFVGQVMRRTGGKADPKRTRELLLELLKK